MKEILLFFLWKIVAVAVTMVVGALIAWWLFGNHAEKEAPYAHHHQGSGYTTTTTLAAAPPPQPPVTAPSRSAQQTGSTDEQFIKHLDKLADEEGQQKVMTEEEFIKHLDKLAAEERP